MSLDSPEPQDRTEHFTIPQNEGIEIRGWIYGTNEYFNELGLTKEEGQQFLENLLEKAQQAKKRDGVNGTSWQDDLSDEEHELVSSIHLRNFYTNCGIELYVRLCRENSTP